ncbi:PilZ domain-containing protein [Massilia sp. CMS3.1]|uniref:PilZ domain-containing protein n=1 Tax=Massilia sp. CMS3.1 TaxID=3373083 RepID=UPI003EE7F15E
MQTGRSFLDDAQGRTSLPERRREVRRVCRVGAVVRMEGLPPMKGRTVDISPAGVALLLPRPFRPGTICHVSFTLYVNGALRKIEAGAEVTNCVFLSADVRIGLRFVSLDERTQSILSGFSL